MSSSMRSWSAFWCTCATSRRRSASSTPMPAPAATISTVRRRRAASNGATASSGSSPPRSASRRVALLAPYLDAVAAFNGPGGLTSYPGSPALVRAFLRPQDRLIACELEPNAAVALARYLAGDRAQQGARDRRLDRASRLCAAEGAARPRADRSAVRARRRFRAPWPGARRCATQMGDRHLSALVSDQGARGAGRARAPPAAERHRKGSARRTQPGRDARRQSARGLRARSSSIRRGRSPASSRSCCRSLRRSSRELAAAPTASIGWQAKSSLRHFSTALD